MIKTNIEEVWGLAGQPAYRGEVEIKGEMVPVTPYYSAEEYGAGARGRAEAALNRFIERRMDEESE